MLNSVLVLEEGWLGVPLLLLKEKHSAPCPFFTRESHIFLLPFFCVHVNPPFVGSCKMSVFLRCHWMSKSFSLRVD